jgi:hypothetical protein
MRPADDQNGIISADRSHDFFPIQIVHQRPIAARCPALFLKRSDGWLSRF